VRASTDGLAACPKRDAAATAWAGGRFDTKPKKNNSLDGFDHSKPSAQLRLEVGDAPVGGGEFAGAVLDLGFEEGEAMGGAVEGADLLAELVDLAGPAGLVGFLAVLGEAGALERGGEFGR
jgi:hypothetical protein